MAVRAPSGTQLDVPIPKAVSSASLEPAVVSRFVLSLFQMGGFSMCIHLLAGLEQPHKVPDPPEKHQWAHRCRTSKQTLCQLCSCCTAGPTA